MHARVQVQREAKAEAKAEAARKEAAALGEGGALAAKTDNHDLMRAIYAIQSQWELCGLGAPNVETIIRCMHMAGEGADVLPAQVEECLVLMHTFGDSLEEHLGFEVRPALDPVTKCQSRLTPQPGRVQCWGVRASGGPPSRVQLTAISPS